ncbi:MAG TPA: DUF5916 domain-containing protein, partial [Pyrinomonadaceae bacterium]|nr:DUF5916 domain-containing protein [Pyrinomonadaceae bacterium]
MFLFSTPKSVLGLVLLICSSSVSAQTSGASSSPVSDPPAKSSLTSEMKTSTANPKASSRVSVPLEKARPLRIPRFDKPPIIDGRIDDEVWKQGAVLRDFYQTNPGDNIAPSKPSEAFLGYDSKFLYFAFHAYDEPDKVRASVARRDQVFGEDNVRMYLDTFNDQRKAYVLGWNPLGVQQDGVLTEGGNTDFSVDIVMESKGQLTPDGWTIEVAIPFKSLRYEAGKGKLWGFHLWRNIDRFNDEIDSWVPISRDINGLLTQAAHLTGLEGVSTEHTLEVIPSLTLSETGKRVNKLSAADLAANPAVLDPGRMLNEPIKFDPGLTLKYGITPTVTLDLAVNPDFAQVEADQTVVTANQRFPIFFQEKRPFFLEGIDIFQTPLQVVHTRAIVDPDAAVKLTGKRGRNTFGLLLASDNAPGNFSEGERNDPQTLPAIRRFLDKNAYIAVLRLKRDVGKESSLGILATSYNFIEKHNQLLSIDGRFIFGAQKSLVFQVLGTTSRRCFNDSKANAYAPSASAPCFAGYVDATAPPATLEPNTTRNFYRTGNGFGYNYTYAMNGRHFTYQLNGQGRTQDYRADVGFTRRRNTNYHDLFLSYNSEPKPKAKLISWRVFNSSRTNFDWQGRTQMVEDEAQVQFSMQRSSYLGVGVVNGYERLFEEEFGPARTATQSGAFYGPDPERSTRQFSPYLFAGSRPSKKYNFDVFILHTNNAFDLDFGAGSKYPRVSPIGLLDSSAPLDPGAGGQWDMSLNLGLQPTNAWNMSVNYNKSRLTRYDTGRIAFDDNIFSYRSTYQFTRFTFARVRIDYDSLESNVRGQFLLGWTPNPGTAFYVGYNDDLARNGYSP